MAYMLYIDKWTAMIKNINIYLLIIKIKNKKPWNPSSPYLIPIWSEKLQPRSQTPNRPTTTTFHQDFIFSIYWDYFDISIFWLSIFWNGSHKNIQPSIYVNLHESEIEEKRSWNKTIELNVKQHTYNFKKSTRVTSPHLINLLDAQPKVKGSIANTKMGFYPFTNSRATMLRDKAKRDWTCILLEKLHRYL
jgi:hypothetical protein